VTNNTIRKPLDPLTDDPIVFYKLTMIRVQSLLARADQDIQ